jgi:5-methylcytosine-specific restriction enzyme subunit McrC
MTSSQTTRSIALTENLPSEPVRLTADELTTLRSLAPSVEVTPAIRRPGWYQLTPGSHVGAVNLGTLSLEIRPKIPIDRVLFLISYAVDPRRWREELHAFTPVPSLVEALIPGFVAQVRRAICRGLLPGYRSEEEALPAVRGRIRFEEQLRRRFLRVPPVEVRFDEFTEDIEENRLLKAALAKLGRLHLRSERVRSSLRAFDVAFQAVSSVTYDSRRLPAIDYTRLNQHYRPAVELAKLVLRSVSFELHGDKVEASAFLVDMNDVFEAFVVVGLREALSLSERSWPRGAVGHWLCLDEADRVKLEPDLSWWEGGRCTFVGDVKYKRVKVAGVRHPDLYQLLAYVTATDLRAGLLIYAAGEGDPVMHRVVQIAKELHVVALQLAGQPEEILEEVRQVGRHVRRLRASEGNRRPHGRLRLTPGGPVMVPQG